MEIKKSIILFLLIFFILFLIDRITKIIFLNKKGCFLFFCFITSFNKGIAFGLFSEFSFSNYLFIVIQFFFLFLFIFFSIKFKEKFIKANQKKQNKIISGFLGLIFIIAGIFGNFIDRIFYNAIIDWLAIKIYSKLITFNLADIYLWIGAILLISFLIINKNKNISKIKK